MARFVKKQKLREVKKRRSFGGGSESSPYWNYQYNKPQTGEDGEILEPPTANPDVLSADQGTYYVSSERQETQEFVRQAIRRAKLSKRERQIVEFLTYTDRTQTEIADVLGLSQPVVSIYYKRALEKMRKYIEKENK